MDTIRTIQIPHVSPSTHVIGVCGVGAHQTKEGTLASDPTLDGWMISDFYLMNHLFRGMGKSQAWFTCHDPQVLVDRFGEYAHGNYYGERRIVLDAAQRPDPATLKIEEPCDLLPKVLQYFESQFRVALNVNEPVLICIFCHGQDSYGPDSKHYSLEIGGEGTYENEAVFPLLMLSDFSRLLDDNPGLNVCLLLTSCFSGGWTISPLLQDQVKRSRVTIVTAASAENPSESWAQTASLRRACGSLYASAIVKALESRDSSLDEDQQTLQLDSKGYVEAVTRELTNTVDPRFGS